MNIELQVVKALWQEPSLKIEQGIPVYFDFTRDKLDEIFSENNISCTDSLELVKVLLDRHLSFEPNKVSISDSIYEPHSSIGVSSCILMVCIQVLAVEDMVKNDDFSENAYFPRFRKLLSSKLSDAEQNPFNADAIDAVWRKISNEIGNKNLLTFSLEKVSGVNRSRHFPLSQALLCGEDILKIVAVLNPDKEASGDSIEEALDKRNLNLTPRGRRLSKLPWLRTEICRQVIFAKSNNRFLGFLETQARIKEKVSSDYEIEIYWDSSEWLKEEYVIGCVEKCNQQQAPHTLIKDIMKTLDTFYIALAPSEFQDSWIVYNNFKIVSFGQAIFIIYLEINKEKVETLITKMGYAEFASIEYGVFKRFVKIGFCKLEIISTNSKINIENGKLASAVKENSFLPAIEFIGGIAVNSHRDRFDCFHLPSSVRYAGEEVLLTGIVEINFRKISFDSFRNSVKELSKHEDFEVTINEDIKFKLKVATRIINNHLTSESLLIHTDLIEDDFSSSSSALELYDKHSKENFSEFCDLLKLRQQSI